MTFETAYETQSSQKCHPHYPMIDGMTVRDSKAIYTLTAPPLPPSLFEGFMREPEWWW